jgi:regulatory protein YycI of two-component signal transduction system YycFG
MKILLRISIVLGIIIIVMLCIVFFQESKVHKENAMLRERCMTLEFQLNAKDIKLNEVLQQAKQSDKDLKTYKSRWASDELYIMTIDSKYLDLVSYCQVAEEILKANGIDFKMTTDWEIK